MFAGVKIMTRLLSSVSPVLAVLLLSCALLGQTPTQLPGQTGPAVPGQQVPAMKPADKPASPTPPSSGGEGQQFYEFKIGANNTAITPNPKDTAGPPLSFLTPGNNITGDFTLYQDHTFGTNRLQILSILRSNDDPRIDPEHNSLQRGYIKLSTPNSEWLLGDALVGYSRLTYNQNIKGLSISRKFGGHFRLLANAGAFTDRWGSIWKDDLMGQPYTRAVAGGRAEFIIAKDKIIGLNFSHGRDIESSIRPDLRQFGLVPLKNQVGSVDGRFTFYRLLTVEGELAYSTTNFDQRIYTDNRKDYGGRLDTSLRSGRFFLRSSYVRLMPTFMALNARQLTDLQDTMVRAGLDLTNNITVEGTYRRTNNNLRNQRPEGTTVFQVPEVRMTLRQFGLGKTIVDVGYRERMQQGPIRQSDPMKGVAESRSVPTPFVEVALPLGNTLISVGWERRLNRNDVLLSERTTSNNWSGSLRSNLDLGGWTFSPMFRYEMETEEFFRVYGFNTNRSMLASGYIDAPKYFTFEATYRMVGASLFAECTQVAGGPPCNPMLPSVPGTTILLPTGYRRPAFHAAITYKVRNNEDRFFVLSFDRNTNVFALPGRDFRERIVALTAVCRFRH